VCLDVAGGTGDIAFRIVDRLRNPIARPRVPPHVIVCDINPAMLRVGQQRAVSLGYAGACVSRGG
jgi:ubiquinone/menaquinone biosynthesis C-methylase UbiE